MKENINNYLCTDEASMKKSCQTKKWLSLIKLCCQIELQTILRQYMKSSKSVVSQCACPNSCYSCQANTTRTKLLPAWKPDVILKLLVLPLVYFCHFFRIFSQFLFFLITSFCHVLSLITIQSTFPPPPHNNWWKYNHINNWFIVIILFLVLYPLLIKFPWLSLFLK